MKIASGAVSGLKLAERKLAQIAEVERRRRVARAALRAQGAWDLVRHSHYRYRDQAWPWVIAALLAIAYFLAAVSAKPSAVFALSLLGSGAVAFHLRNELDRKIEWAQACTCLAATTVGLTLVAAVGIHNRGLNAACVVIFAIAATRWWLHHQVRTVTAPNESETVRLWREHVAGDPTVESWNDHIGGRGSRL